MISDPIADMLIRIKNGYMAHKEFITIPFSKFKFDICKVLAREGYLLSCLENEKDKTIDISLKYQKEIPIFTDIKRISKPGLRVYKNKKGLITRGIGITIISTPKGIMTTKEAKKNHFGGELICKIW